MAGAEPRRGFAFLIAFAGVVAAVWVAGRWFAGDDTTPLTAAILGANESRWLARATGDYDLEFVLRKDRRPDEAWIVHVRGGSVESMKLDGVAAKRPNDAYTVTGLFDIMRRELELAGSAKVPEGARRGALLEARFDTETGAPLRFKAIAAEGRSFFIDVLRLERPDGTPIVAAPAS